MSNPIIKQINIAPLFHQLGLDVSDYQICEIPEMYPFKQRVEDNWAYYTAAAFIELRPLLQKEQAPFKNLAIVGIGSGVEGIAALKVFQSDMKNLVLTDIDKVIAQGAVDNIGLQRVNVIPLVGSFAEPLAALPFKLDFIFGNVPNLPSADNQKLDLGEDKGTFVPVDSYQNYHVPRKYQQWALASQYAYLQSAKEALAVGGSVFTELGGRIPLNLVLELFADCNLKMSEVLAGFKEQTEALIDFQGYHKLEKIYGVNFDFYLYEDSVSLMNRYGIANPAAAVSGEQLKLLLQPFKINAGQALELYKQGIKVGHTVHIFRGQHL